MPASRSGRCFGPGWSAWVAAAGLLAALLAALPAAAQPLAPSAEGRVIVKFKAEALAPAAPGRAAPFSSAQAALQAVGGRMGMALGRTAGLGGRMQALRVSGIASEVLAQRLARDPAVEYAVPDQRRRALAVPNDERYGPGLGGSGPDVGQWYLRAPDASAPAAINAEAAWDITVGAADVRVAVLDTGVLFNHPDLLTVAGGGKLLPGYDMIDDTDTSADLNGRDSDASDPGDAADCDGVPENSSWHGTQVSGLIGAITNNGFGMAGVGWDTPIVPVRVLGRCGGFDSDIQAAMLWAAGVSVGGVPPNPNPARVINLSLGGSGPCNQAYADVIAELAQLRPSVVVVAAAGNSAGHAVSTPANCPGVIAVGGLRHVGTKVGFADLGPELALSAPAGNCVNTDGGPCLFPILTATNSGEEGPAAHTFSDSFNTSVGTSFSTPLVAGVAALMLERRPTLTAAELRYRLQASARPFPTSGSAAGTPFCAAPSGADQLECYCTTSTCGAGMLDAAAAVQGLPTAPEESFLGSLPGVLARITPLTAAPAAGQPVQFTAAATQVAPGHAIASYQWELLDGGGIVTALSGSDTVAAQAVPTANGSFTLRLTVTDDLGRSSQATHAAQVGEVPADSGGGDGGGALHEAALAALLAAVLAAGAVRRRFGPAAWRTD